MCSFMVAAGTRCVTAYIAEYSESINVYWFAWRFIHDKIWETFHFFS
jgi:hypothetical protein